MSLSNQDLIEQAINRLLFFPPEIQAPKGGWTGMLNNQGRLKTAREMAEEKEQTFLQVLKSLEAMVDRVRSFGSDPHVWRAVSTFPGTS